MTASLADRYEAGEERAVWAELHSLQAEGETDAEALHDVAWPVVEATMARVVANVATIIDRLHQLGYRWAAIAVLTYPKESTPASEEVRALWDQSLARAAQQHPEIAAFFEQVQATRHDLDDRRYDWAPPGREVEDDIDTIEEALGPLPLALRGLLQFVGEVDLAGSLPSWDPSAFAFDPPEPWARFGLYTCPLSLHGVKGILDYLDDTDFVDLGGDAIAAAGFSGGNHVVQLPGAPIDPVVSGIIGHPPMTLVEYLRWVFDWAGFPGFEAEPEVPPEIQALRSEMLPI